MKSSLWIAAALTAATVAWLATSDYRAAPDSAPGAPLPAPAPAGAPAAAKPDAAPTTPLVRVARLSAQPVQQQLTLLGHTAGNRRVELRSELAGRVDQVLVERGRPVAAQAPIVRLAVEDRAAAVDRARALLTQRTMEFAAARELGTKGFNSEIRVSETAALLEAARAELKRAEIALDRVTITAPFAGMLDRRMVEEGNVLQEGDPVGVLVDLDPIRIIGQVSERAIAGLAIGQAGRAVVVTGREVAGRIAYLAAVADPATRTFQVELEVPNPDGTLIEGLTARLHLPLAERRGHFVARSVLTLDDDGTLGVRTVDAADRVQFLPVQILRDEPDGLWLAGLPDPVDLIVVGQEFVVDGQKVRPVRDAAQIAAGGDSVPAADRGKDLP